MKNKMTKTFEERFNTIRDAAIWAIRAAIDNECPDQYPCGSVEDMVNEISFGYPEEDKEFIKSIVICVMKLADIEDWYGQHFRDTYGTKKK